MKLNKLFKGGLAISLVFGSVLMNGCKKSDETVDKSDREEPISLNEKDKERILSGCRNLGREGELSLNSYIGSEAKKIGVEKNKLKQYLKKPSHCL